MAPVSANGREFLKTGGGNEQTKFGMLRSHQGEVDDPDGQMSNGWESNGLPVAREEKFAIYGTP